MSENVEYRLRNMALRIGREMATGEANHKPPATVAKEAKQGLELRKKHGRGGTPVGARTASRLASGKEIPHSLVKRMNSYFQRHKPDESAPNFKNKDTPSNGKIAALLWGGESGKKWAAETVEKHKGD